MRSAVRDIGLNAYMDDQLSPEQRASVEALLRDDPEQRGRLQAMAAQKELLRTVIAGLSAREDTPRVPGPGRRRGVAPASLPDPAITAALSPHAGIRQLLAALDRLPEAQCEALILMALENMQYRDATRILAVSPEIFVSRLIRGREALRRALESAGDFEIRVVGGRP